MPIVQPAVTRRGVNTAVEFNQVLNMSAAVGAVFGFAVNQSRKFADKRIYRGLLGVHALSLRLNITISQYYEI
jgi:hypothetical protein